MEYFGGARYINNDAVLKKYGEIDHFLESNGRSVGDNDTWIAATAAATSATLLTTDKDFDPLEGTFISRIYVDPAPPESAGSPP